jgi:serine/threonine protein kinase
MAWAVGQIVGSEYTIDRKLGEGGFGITYRAVKQNGQRVVIKTLNDTVQRLPNFVKLQEDFLNEALRLAKCPHPHIAKVERVFQEGRLWCMVMEYIDGGNLGDRVAQKGALPEDEALLYMQQIGEALTLVHQRGLLHRDIKPLNIMLRSGRKEAVLIDFGIAREFTPDLTQTHTLCFTEGYAPIEQYYQRYKRGAYTDVYALAATFYSLLTGVVPVSALNREQGVKLKPPKQLNPKISDQTNQAILKGMAIKPGNRPQSITAWLTMLGIATVPVSPKQSQATRSNRIVLFAIGTLMALVIALIMRPPNISIVTPNPLSTPTPEITVTPTESSTPTPNVPSSPPLSFPVNAESLFVILPQFDLADRFSQGLAVVEINDKVGYLARKGNIIIQPQFNYPGLLENGRFSEGLAAIKVNNKYGFINQEGEIIIRPQFDYVSFKGFSEGLAAVSINNKWGYIDKVGSTIIQPQFNEVGDAMPFSEGLARVKINGKYGFIDKAGNVIIQPNFDWALPFTEGLAMVEINDKFGYIDKAGNITIPIQFSIVPAAKPFSEGLAPVYLNGKYGYIDKIGNIVIQPQFDDAESFSEGLAAVYNYNRGWGYINKSGEFIVQPQFGSADLFSEGLARVSINGKYGFINKTGNTIIKLELRGGSNDAHSFFEGLARVEINGKWGYIRNPLLARDSRGSL